jgi:hypothetical protein
MGKQTIIPSCLEKTAIASEPKESNSKRWLFFCSELVRSSELDRNRNTANVASRVISERLKKTHGETKTKNEIRHANASRVSRAISRKSRLILKIET